MPARLEQQQENPKTAPGMAQAPLRMLGRHWKAIGKRQQPPPHRRVREGTAEKRSCTFPALPGILLPIEYMENEDGEGATRVPAASAGLW